MIVTSLFRLVEILNTLWLVIRYTVPARARRFNFPLLCSAPAPAQPTGGAVLSIRYCVDVLQLQFAYFAYPAPGHSLRFPPTYLADAAPTVYGRRSLVPYSLPIGFGGTRV